MNKDIIVYTSACNIEVRGIVLSLKRQNRPVVASNLFTVLTHFIVQYCVTKTHNCQFGITFLRTTSRLPLSTLGFIPMSFPNQTNVCFRQFSYA